MTDDLVRELVRERYSKATSSWWTSRTSPPDIADDELTTARRRRQMAEDFAHQQLLVQPVENPDESLGRRRLVAGELIEPAGAPTPNAGSDHQPDSTGRG